MEIRKTADGETRLIPATNQFVKPGETVDVPDEIAKGLLQQAGVWEPVDTKPAARKAREGADD